MKKGFTLVELLAVIAILAILVLIAVPNVVSLLNQSKINSFLMETKSLVKIAQEKYTASKVENVSSLSFSNCPKYKNDIKLDTTTNGTKYYIELTPQGEVSFLGAWNGKYLYQFDGEKGITSLATGTLNIEDIEDRNINVDGKYEVIFLETTEEPSWLN